MRRGRVLVVAGVLPGRLAVSGCAVLLGAALLGPGVARAAAEWTVPLDGGLSIGRDFAPPADRYGSGHRGVDLAGAVGAPVLAAGDGRVSYAGLLAGRGVVVVVHGELRTTYEPVDAVVRVGDVVTAGQRIGTLAAGHAGCSAAACLHWGLRRGEEYLDPLTLVGGGPVRLLPLEPPGDAPAPATGGAGGAAGGGGVTRSAATSSGPVSDGVPAAAPDPASGAATEDRPSPGAAAGPAPLEPAADDTTSVEGRLRSAASPSGALALAALVAGIALLRPGRPPRRPGGAPAVAVSPGSDEPGVAEDPAADGPGPVPSQVEAEAGEASPPALSRGAGAGETSGPPLLGSVDRDGTGRPHDDGDQDGTRRPHDDGDRAGPPSALRPAGHQAPAAGTAGVQGARVVDLAAERERRRAWA